MQLTIRPETDTDQEAIRNINRMAFHRNDEADLVDSLRIGKFVRLSLVAIKDDQIVGHILFSELQILAPGKPSPAVALAPLAILPQFQFQGIGTSLMKRGIDLCREHGERLVFVLGYPPFYRRVGFSAELAARFEAPFSGDAFMALELVPGAANDMIGRVEYPAPFGVTEVSSSHHQSA